MVLFLVFWIMHSDWTNRIIEAQDHASVMVCSQYLFVYGQINVVRLDPKTGVATGEYDTISLGGYIRSKVGLVS